MSATAAEWAKFRTVRGWVVAVVIAAAAIAGLALIDGMHGTCTGNSCALPTGPGGEAVTDSFYFVHRQLAGDGTITVRVDSLTGQIPAATGTGMQPGLVPWAKAGIIVKASLAQGSAYAAMMLTGGHGVRMQYDYTGDVAAPAINARWLRLARHGDQVTGYESADGARWINTHRHCQSVTPRPAMIERNIEHIINGVIRAHDIGARNQMARLLRIGGNLGLVMLKLGLRETHLHVWTDYVRSQGRVFRSGAKC